MSDTSCSPTLDLRIQVCPDVIIKPLQGESVLLDLRSATYFGLNEVGTRIWQLLAEDLRLREIAQVIVGEYTVDEDKARTDVLNLVQQLASNGLITLGT